MQEHVVYGQPWRLYVHRKDAMRAFGPGHPDLPAAFREYGQPLLIGGSMGTASHILAGNQEAEALSFSSACHGAGRTMSHQKAYRTWKGRQLTDNLHKEGIIIHSPSSRSVTEEAPGA